MRIVYFGNNMFSSCLKYLISEGFEVVRVYVNSPDFTSSVISKLCETHQIPLFKNKPMSEELEHLISMGVEMFIVAEYLHILPETGVKYAINIHPSRLPKGRGPTPLPYLLKYPEHSGVSIHKLTNVVDGGDVILQSDVPIQTNESITTVMVKMHIEAVNLIKTFLSDVECHYKNAKPQTDYSYFPRIDIGERILDWKQPTLDINSKLRSFGFFGLILKLNNLFWNAKHIEAVECVHLYEAGEVIYEDEYLLVVSSYDGIVCVHKYSLSLVT